MAHFLVLLLSILLLFPVEFISISFFRIRISIGPQSVQRPDISRNRSHFHEVLVGIAETSRKRLLYPPQFIRFSVHYMRLILSKIL